MGIVICRRHGTGHICYSAKAPPDLYPKPRGSICVFGETMSRSTTSSFVGFRVDVDRARLKVYVNYPTSL